VTYVKQYLLRDLVYICGNKLSDFYDLLEISLSFLFMLYGKSFELMDLPMSGSKYPSALEEISTSCSLMKWL